MTLSCVILEMLGETLAKSLIVSWLVFVNDLVKFRVAEFSTLFRMIILIFIVSCCLSQHGSMSSGQERSIPRAF